MLVFSNLYSLFLYLLIVLFLYYITPLKWRNLLLLLVNLVFYTWGEPVYILIMFPFIGIDYIHGMLVKKYRHRSNDRGARWAVASSVIFNLVPLFSFKYWNFIASSLQAVGFSLMSKLGLNLSIGISFYTFQTMSCTIDVYRDGAKVQRNLVNFGTFIILFPQLIAGPIIRYEDLGDQVDRHTHPPEQFASDMQIFVVGLAKKVLLTNNVGKLWDTILALPARELTTTGAWLGVAVFAFQLCFDFSGYSDTAVGLGRVLGFEFMRNFNYLYIVKSTIEFWRRWYISLGTWSREYLYILLGGNRVNRSRSFLNLLVVQVVTGIWHGASQNFLIWGLYFAILLASEKAFLDESLQKLPAALQHLYTLFLVLVSQVIFTVEDSGHTEAYPKVMLGLDGGLINDNVSYYFFSFLPVLIIAVMVSTPLAAKLWKCLPEGPRLALLPILLLTGLAFPIAYPVGVTYNPFLYFQL